MLFRFLFPFEGQSVIPSLSRNLGADLEQSRFIFQHGAPAAPAPGPHAPPPHGRGRRQRQEGEEAEQAQEATRRRIRSIDSHPEFPADVRLLARRAATSEDPARRYYVDQLLRGELAPDNFRQMLEQDEAREESWKRISAIQRKIREKINALHERAEAYYEAMPSEHLPFSAYLDQVAKLNLDDNDVDRELKTILIGLANPTQREQAGVAVNIPAVLTHGQAEDIYKLDPIEPGFDAKFRKLTSRITDGQITTRLFELKERERLIEMRFNRLYSDMEQIIEHNLGRATRIAEESKMLKNATRATGINVKAGTVIKYQDSDILSLAGRTQTARIQSVTFDRVPVFDHRGRIVSYAVGHPMIRINNIKMPLGRFKKWVDATNAVEQPHGIHDVEKHIGWNELGMTLKPGVELEYQRFEREANGTLKRCPEKVSIREIKDGNVVFSRPIIYQTGPYTAGIGLQSEPRESLALGEFVKWYHRNEVEKALSIEELHTALEEYNKTFNRKFSVDPKENPPIMLRGGEKLYYSDGSGLKFTITSVADDKIALDNGMSYTPAQFLYWVRNNYVKRYPEAPKAKPKEEIGKELAKKHKEEEEKHEAEERKHELEHKEEHRRKAYLEREAIGPSEYLKKVWFSTTLLSMMDVKNFFHSVKEFIKRKHERRTKGRYSTVGGKLPGILGTEFERIRQTAENEEVHQYKEAMDHWGIFQVKRTLHLTHDKDEAKACIETLIGKGEMRFDDHLFWETLNRLTARYTTQGAKLYIPHKEHMPPGMSGEDMTHGAIDALWGQGTGSEWFQKNISTYNNNKKNFAYKGDQLEADPKSTGGLRGELTRLLREWRSGEYVNPQEYEELIEFAIVKGKMSAGDKLFFLIMGIIAQNPKVGNETLLHLDRAGQLDGEHLNRFPLLDFFTNKGIYRDYDATKGAWRIEDYEHWAKTYFPNDLNEGRPGVEFESFLWHVVMFDDQFRTRLSKGIRSAEAIDHDDVHLFFPPLSLEEVDMATGSPGGGEKKYFTQEGYCNAYPGYNQFFIAIATKKWKDTNEDRIKREQNLKNALKGFVRFDATMDNRYDREKGVHKARLAEHHYSRACVVDNTVALRLHQRQLQNLVRAIGRAYGEDVEYLFEKPAVRDKAREKELQLKHNEFNDMVDHFFEIDGGRRITEEVLKAKERDPASEFGLRGMRGWTVGRSVHPDTAVVKTEDLGVAKERGLL